jgi:hypothetical protein
MSRQKRVLRTERVAVIEQKAKTTSDCAQRMNPHLDAKAKRKMVKAIPSVVHGKDGPAPRRQISGAQCVELVWSNSQCVHTRTGKCPLLIFGEQLAQQLNTFFVDDE